MTLERRILLWMCVLVAVNQFGFGAMVPSVPLYAQSFGVPASAIGMAIAAYGLARFMSALPAGKLSDMLGRRKSLAIGGLISAAGNIWCAWATSYPEFIIARFVAGFGAGLVLTTGNIVLADISTPEVRGRMIAIYQGTFIFSVGLGPFPGGLLAEHVGLEAPFLFSGLGAFLATIVAWFAVEETRGMSQSKAGTSAITVSFLAQIRTLMSNVGYMLVSLISLMNAVVRTGGLFAIIPLLATARLGISVSAIGFGMMLGSIAGLFASYPAGWLADRYGRKAVIVPVTLVSGLSMVLFCVAPNYPWFVAACIVWGIAIAAGGSAPAAYAADSAPPGMNAAAMSTFRMTGDLGYVVGPLALGFVADHFGPVVALLSGAAGLVLVGATFALFAGESRPRKPAA